MLNKPISLFLVGLVFFLIIIDELPYTHHLSDITGLICLFASFLFELLAVIKGVKQIKRKENSFLYNLIAVIGGTLILILLTFFGVLVLSLSIDGFPVMS